MNRVIKTIISVALVVLIIPTMLCSCSGKVSVDDLLTFSNVNDSPENVVSGFFQAIYTDDRALFQNCFYPGALDTQGVDAFAEYRKVAQNRKFVGTKHISTRPCDSNNGLDYNTVKDNIAFFNGVNDDLIDNIQLVSVKLFLTIDNETMYIETYSIAYRTKGKWYFFSMVDQTARSISGQDNLEKIMQKTKEL